MQGQNYSYKYKDRITATNATFGKMDGWEDKYIKRQDYYVKYMHGVYWEYRFGCSFLPTVWEPASEAFNFDVLNFSD